MPKKNLANEKSGLANQYYVFGSGLFGFSTERINEVPKLKQEYHEQESKKALLMLSVPRHL